MRARGAGPVTVFVLLLSAVVLAGGCGGSGGEPPPEPGAPLDPDVAETVANEVDALVTEYVDHLAASRWRSVLGLYSDDERFYWVEGGRTTYDSRVEIGDQMAIVYPQVRSNDFTASNRRVTPLSASLATVSIDFEQRLELTSGQAIALAGTMTAIVAKEAEGWKFLIGHTTGVNQDAG